MTTSIDPAIVEVIRRTPNQMIKVKFVFDGNNEFINNNLITAKNYLNNFSSLIHSERKGSDSSIIIDVTVQAFVCETIAKDCVALKAIVC